MIKVKLDTGVQVNVMPLKVYNSINTKSRLLKPTKVKFNCILGKENSCYWSMPVELQI